MRMLVLAGRQVTALQKLVPGKTLRSENAEGDFPKGAPLGCRLLTTSCAYCCCMSRSIPGNTLTDVLKHMSKYCIPLPANAAANS